MAIIGFSHAAICVSDIDRSIAFYEKLGFKPSQRLKLEGETYSRLLDLPDAAIELAFVELGTMRVELVQYHNPPATAHADTAINRFGITHLSVRILDYDATLDELEGNGVRVLRQTMGSFDGSNARFAFCLDPDGTRIELLGAIDDGGHLPWDF
jgi:catechol 2,3-dioxygenase-like lactoylglutathione lyase family enzyme